jgi:dTDP-4-dehydrorhamnose reductase
MKVLVTGSEGQLARSLRERASAHSGLDLIFAGRPVIDLADPGSAQRLIAETVPDVVINAAAYTAVDRAEDEPELAFRINADAAGEIAAAAAHVGAAVIQISTDYVFSGDSEASYSEDAAVAPANVYGRSKLAGEEQVRSANRDHLIVRTAWIYSPFGRNFVTTIVAAAQARDELRVVADQIGSPTSAFDLADGLFRVLDLRRKGDGRTGVYHLVGTGSTSWCNLAEAIMAECRRHGMPAADVLAITTADWPTKAVRPRNSVLDSTKFAREFGFVMPPWQRSLAEVMNRLAAGR